MFMCTTLHTHSIAAFAKLSSSTAGLLSSSLLCFPDLLLPPFTNGETFFLMRARRDRKRNVSPFLGQGDSGLM